MIELLPAGRKRNGIDGSEHNLTHATLQRNARDPCGEDRELGNVCLWWGDVGANSSEVVLLLYL